MAEVTVNHKVSDTSSASKGAAAGGGQKGGDGGINQNQANKMIAAAFKEGGASLFRNLEPIIEKAISDAFKAATGTRGPKAHKGLLFLKKI